RNLQIAGHAAGFDLGFQPDGEYGPATAAVVRRYQDANNLPTGGLTLDTLRRLGVSVTSS
ncbi:MAG: peptidoglycan-binding domain-containing protein, partial [Pseudomonadota bacterium]